MPVTSRKITGREPSESKSYRCYPDIGEGVKRLINKNNINPLVLSCVLSILPSFQMTPRSVLDSLKLITRGYLFGRVSSERELIHSQLHLERASHIMYTCGA